LDTQLTKLREFPRSYLGSILGAILVIILCAIGGWYSWRLPENPYVDRVLSLTGNPTIGHAIFQSNCSGCHGLDASGRVGPSLYRVSRRKSPSSLIEQVISGKTPPMPQFQPNPQAMADLLSYLETL
jgi:mono/diheme cytochrome c family protein